VPDGVRLAGEAGSRAPHVWLERARSRIATLDLYERTPVLLSAAGADCPWHAAAARVAARPSVSPTPHPVRDGPDPDLRPADADCPWHAAAAGVAERLSVPLTAYRVGDGPDTALRPADGADWAGAHGITAGGAVLVRPDGFVAWRSEGPVTDPARVLREVVGAVLDRH